MKEPKAFKRPRLYWRKAEASDELEQRIRIVYPNGHAEYADGMICSSGCWYDKLPCWMNGTVTKGKQAVKLMKNYDKKRGFKTIFLGEI